MGDWSSCGTTGVNDTCLINAVEALNFEKNQIQNFFKQKARLENQNKVTGNRRRKKRKKRKKIRRRLSHRIKMIIRQIELRKERKAKSYKTERKHLMQKIRRRKR